MLQLKIVSPEKVEFDGAVESVFVPTLQKGTVEYVTGDGKSSLDILGGFVEVQKNVVSLCVELKA